MRRLVREKRGGDTIFCKDFSDAELIRMKTGGFGCRCCCYCGSGMPVESGDFSASPTGDRCHWSLGKLTCCKLCSSCDSREYLYDFQNSPTRVGGFSQAGITIDDIGQLIGRDTELNERSVLFKVALRALIYIRELTPYRGP